MLPSARSWQGSYDNDDHTMSANTVQLLAATVLIQLTSDPYRLKPVTTQHALTTQHIEVLSGLDDTGRLYAEATTYFTGIHFGQGRWKGKQVMAYGKYVDSLVQVRGQDGSYEWRIRRREVTFFGRVGEEGVMDGEAEA